MASSQEFITEMVSLMKKASAIFEETVSNSKQVRYGGSGLRHALNLASIHDTWRELNLDSLVVLDG